MTALDPRQPVTTEAVLDAALTLFAERGYHGTALSQIAEMLGIRTPSLYNHMRSKQELLQAIVGRTTAAVFKDFKTVVSRTDNPVAQLWDATEVYAYRHAIHRREALIVNRDTNSLDEPYRSRFQSRRREHEHAFRALIARGVSEGLFRVDSPALASFAIREMCVSIARWFHESGPLSAEEVAREYSRYALRIVGAQSDKRPGGSLGAR